jgi:hypothetical protein
VTANAGSSTAGTFIDNSPTSPAVKETQIGNGDIEDGFHGTTKVYYYDANGNLVVPTVTANSAGSIPSITAVSSGIAGAFTSTGFTALQVNSKQNSAPAVVFQAGGSGTSASTVPVLKIVWNGNPLVCGAGGTSFDILSIDQKGDVKACGSITGNTPPLTAQRTSAGPSVISYAPQQTQPSIEDFGQGELVNGHAYVRLDPAFAATIDPQVSYLVFLTPGGDNRGLYVAQKTHLGFWVHESQGGRATLSFDYRIVAKPYGVNEQRLPFARVALPR